ncbi:MAG TPA: hypothetical protein VNM16_06990 [Bacillota bacterium]|nr:hypothetical protein [Bacillota bacterium]
MTGTADAPRAALDALEGREGALPASFVADMLREALESRRQNRRRMPPLRRNRREKAGAHMWRACLALHRAVAVLPESWPPERERAFGVAFLREWLGAGELTGEDAKAALAEQARAWG